jgi:type IV pilus assembly protein PilA
LTGAGDARTISFMTEPGGLPPGFPPLTVQPVNPAPAAPSKLTGGKMLLIVIAIIGVFVFLVVLLLAPLAIFGVRKYLTNAKMGEGRANVGLLARGIARCAAEVDPATNKPRGLPESSLGVPATLADVKGQKYQSASAEWGDPAFVCAGFQVASPQYFQYRWVKRSLTTGAARGVADLDGDGSADGAFELPVTCSAGRACSIGTLATNDP